MLDYLKRQAVRVAVGIAIIALAMAHMVDDRLRWGFLDRLENIAYDARLVLTMPRTRDERVVIVDIDEKSLAEEGRWPWSRSKVALLVEQLFERYGAAIVAFDVVFAEAEETSGLDVVDALSTIDAAAAPGLRARLDEIRRGLDHDAKLAETMSGRDVILGYFLSSASERGAVPRVGELPAPLFQSSDFEGRDVPIPVAQGYSANLAALQRSARGAGHLISVPDDDGIVRRVPMLFEYEKGYYEALSLAVVRAYLKDPPIRAGFPPDAIESGDYTGIEWLGVGEHRIPVDLAARALVPFRGPQGSFAYISATDILHGTASEDVLRDKIVLVGTTSKGLLDLRATPVAPDFPGVEIHANLVAGMLDDSILENPAYALGAEVLLLLVCGLLMTLALPALSPLLAAAVTSAILAGVVGLNLWMWSDERFVFPLATILVTILTLFLFNMSWGFFVESRGKRQLAGRFGQYVPPELVDEMADDPNAFTMETTSRELTVLFSDVRDFTTISEGLSPQDLTDLMNAYLTPMTRIIYDHRGTIDKYMGDAIMAFWGAPLADPNHAEHALATATDMLERVHRLEDEFAARGWPPVKIGVGLNTGEMRVGNMGSTYRVAYTVMGDAVNLGSRLEGLTKEYGVELIVNETTAAAVPDYAYRELDRVRVKGKDKPVTIFEPIGPKAELTEDQRSELGLYREALKLYRARNWDMAEIQFLNLSQRAPARALYDLYAKRASFFREEPPPEQWDGVFTFKTK